MRKKKKLFNQLSVTPCIAATVTTTDSYLEEKNLKISDVCISVEFTFK